MREVPLCKAVGVILAVAVSLRVRRKPEARVKSPRLGG
jgi:hypothetical protein